MTRSWAYAGMLASIVACSTDETLVEPDPHLDRMLAQQKRLPYGEDPAMPRGMTMMQPPEGTLPTTTTMGDPIASTGMDHDHYAAAIPISVDRPMIELGRGVFETICATCHGILGDGVSVVAAKMARRKPPNLQDARIRAYPAGRVFRAVREGYGLMPSYAVQISVDDAWAVVAYVEALQIAHGVRVDQLPPDVRAELEKEAP